MNQLLSYISQWGSKESNITEQQPWKTVSSKLNLLIPYHPVNICLGIYPKKLKKNITHKTLHMNVYSKFINNCHNLETTMIAFSW